VVSISTLYFSPNLGMISAKCLQGLPPGSFKKTLIFSMFFTPFVEITPRHFDRRSAWKSSGPQK
jgi:hypothetical protein